MEYNRPDSLENTLRDIERRLLALESAQRAPYTSIKGGTLTVLTESGDDVVNLGEIALSDINPPAISTEIGIDVQAPGADILLATSDRGLILPLLNYPTRRIQDTIVVTSGSFVDTWQVVSDHWPSTAIYVAVAVGVAAGTTAEVRLRLIRAGFSDLFTSAHTVPQNTANTYVFRWDLVGNSVPIGSSFLLNVQARRTAGSGNVEVHDPGGVHNWDTKLRGADTDGIYI